MKFVKIKKIERTETEPIYHLTVEKNHNFFGNGMCLHNCDYYENPSNDGNIGLFLRNLTNKEVRLQKGERVAQGIFVKYLVSDNCNKDNIRKGGFGSTSK